MKSKKHFLICLVVIIFATFFSGGPAKASTTAATTPAPVTTAVGPFQYQLLEAFPGFYAVNSIPDLPTFILDIYKFGIWTVGIAGLFMLTIGGFMYMTSAGNTATASNAKGVISDAIIGIIAAMCAYLILYVINPDLTKINLALIPVTPVSAPNFGGAGGGTGTGNGTCAPVTSGACAVSRFQNTCFSSVASQASAICLKESSGIEDKASLSDKCTDGNSFSWGLFQINLTQHNIGGNNCKAPNGAFSAFNYKCTVKNPSLYNNCTVAASNAATNINAACQIYQGEVNAGRDGWNQWGANYDPKKPGTGCGF